MAQSNVSATRVDPYRDFTFRVRWDGRYVAGVSKIGGLKRVSEVIEHRQRAMGSPSRRLPGRTRYEPIILERGVTHDAEFANWAAQGPDVGSAPGADVELNDFGKDLIIEVYNAAGQLALGYTVFRAWVSEYQALPDLDANANAIAIERIRLEYEGCERRDVPLPTEPQFVE